MTRLQTPADLLETLNKAAKRRPSAEELRQQSVSFVMGSVREESGITREQIEEVLSLRGTKR